LEASAVLGQDWLLTLNYGCTIWEKEEMLAINSTGDKTKGT
jgi:hypothetical protein